MPDHQEHAEVVDDGAPRGTQWSPAQGTELAGLMERSGLPEDGQSQVIKQAAQVLGGGIDPSGTGSERRTGLVVGYVQSGKTMSFTSVAAMAHDNRFRLVILLTGTKTNLHDQTTKRLERDLDTGRDRSPWLVLANPGATVGNLDELSAVLQVQEVGSSGNRFFDWQQSNRTALVTVMKNTTRIDKVRDLMNGLPGRGIDLSELSVLVIDDEADQAGLNTKASSDEEEPSATYRAIHDLRDALPRHTYLEYTATPQAPLLLNVLDTLAPDFCVVLKAGRGYTGGELFFGSAYPRFVKSIPAHEAGDALGDDPSGPPETLKAALASYLVSGLLMTTREVSPASMLVHPSQTRNVHERFARWVRTILTEWADELRGGGPIADGIIDDYVRPAYDNATGDVGSDEQFTQLRQALSAMIQQVQVRVVNSAAETNAIDFNNHRFWILVGGNKLDRGYTVEGLVTTYMPRGVGGGQADTIQQRARFFGYKQDYEDLCRAWLTRESSHQYRRYVEHETHLRNSLQALVDAGESLATWRRQMLFDPQMKPCRAGVISMPYVRERVKGNQWTRIESIYGHDAWAEHNRVLVNDMIATHGSDRVPDPADPRTRDRTTVFQMRLDTFMRDVLASWKHSYEDSVLNSIALLLSARLDERPDLKVEIYYMRDGLTRQRRLVHGTRVLNLMEGRRPGRGARFPGDTRFHSDEPDTVSVQVHRVDITENESVIKPDVPALAIWMPDRLAADILREG